MPEWSQGVDSSSTAQDAWAQTLCGAVATERFALLRRRRRNSASACLETAWPSGLRRWLQVSAREAVGSNANAVARVGVALASSRQATFFRSFVSARVSSDCLAEWSKPLAQGASPQGLGFESRSCHSLCFVKAFGARCARSEVDVESAVPGSVGRCLSGASLDAAPWQVRRHRPCRRSPTLLAPFDRGPKATTPPGPGRRASGSARPPMSS